MKKICIALLILLSLNLQANAQKLEKLSNDELIYQLNKTVINANPKKLEKIWAEINRRNPNMPQEYKNEYEKVWLDVKLRHDQIVRYNMRSFLMGAAIGAAQVSAQSAVAQQNMYNRMYDDAQHMIDNMSRYNMMQLNNKPKSYEVYYGSNSLSTPAMTIRESYY